MEITQESKRLSAMSLSSQVWRFILEREVEAPERFQAIQSYRATMAVLRQQALFVEQLFETGVVDEMEKEELLQCAPWTLPCRPCPAHVSCTPRRALWIWVQRLYLPRKAFLLPDGQTY